MLGMAGTLGTVTALIAGTGLFVAGWAVGAWLLCALLVGFAARSRGRAFAPWLLLAIVVTPIVAALVLASFADRSALRVREAARRGRDGMRLCPSCAEVIWAQARRCRFCLADLTSRPVPAAQPPAALATEWRAQTRLDKLTDKRMDKRPEGRVEERVEPSLQ
ncbi:MAG: hypothetical protein GX652_00800 [Burkholderiaceae bacterium]|nr:hypothetical protein [Burkholderiaceae bacterium]